MTQKRRYPPIHPWLYNTLKAILRALAKMLVRTDIRGMEYIPPRGGVIFVTNHLHYFDSPLIFIAIPRTIYVLAAEKYEHHLLFGPLLRIAGAIFINRGEPDRRALRQALAVLEDGYALGVAAEGTRSRTGGLGPGKTGAAYLATRAGVPLVPTVVWGTEKVISGWLRLKRPEVHLRFGPPIHLPAGRARSEELERYTEEIMTTLASMLPEEYRGVYRDHPLLEQKLAEQDKATAG